MVFGLTWRIFRRRWILAPASTVANGQLRPNNASAHSNRQLVQKGELVAFNRVKSKQNHQRADNRRAETFEVESVYTSGSEGIE